MQCNVTIRNAPSHNPPLGSSCQASPYNTSDGSVSGEKDRGDLHSGGNFLLTDPSSRLKKSVVFGSKTTDFGQLLEILSE